MDQESLKSILILGRLPLCLFGIGQVYRFLGPRFWIEMGLWGTSQYIEFQQILLNSKSWELHI